MKAVEPIYVQVGQRLRMLRQMAGISQDEVAVSVGLTRTSIVNIESGRQRVLMHDIAKLAKAVRVSPDVFTRGIWS